MGKSMGMTLELMWDWSRQVDLDGVEMEMENGDTGWMEDWENMGDTVRDDETSQSFVKQRNYQEPTSGKRRNAMTKC